MPRACAISGRKSLRWTEIQRPSNRHAPRRFRPEFVLLDLGVSSGQLDLDERGFSFRRGVPLDMRLSGEGPTAADILNHRSAGALADIFRRYGDESRSRRLATRIVERRARQPFHTSDDLVNAIRSALGPRSGPSDFARLFQAVRIAVNDELGELERALPGLRDALVSEGRLAVITYHSGEDRIVKRAFRDWARVCVCPPPQPICTCRGRPLGRCDPRKPILPTPEEIRANRRARSAKLRAFRVVHGA
jgi:16S rRNA (cytosine1402-N4)-methyltransferase